MHWAIYPAPIFHLKKNLSSHCSFSVYKPYRILAEHDQQSTKSIYRNHQLTDNGCYTHHHCDLRSPQVSPLYWKHSHGYNNQKRTCICQMSEYRKSALSWIPRIRQLDCSACGIHVKKEGVQTKKKVARPSPENSYCETVSCFPLNSAPSFLIKFAAIQEAVRKDWPSES